MDVRGQNIVVLGSTGMAGHMVADVLSKAGARVTGIARSADTRFVQRRVDAEDATLLHATLQDLRPHIVVNCIGVLNARAEAEPRRAIVLNSLLPHELADWGDELGFTLIHVSTDCVFSGKTGEYTEASEPDGGSVYARTKALGEVCSGSHLTFRTSIVGPELERDGSGLMEWFLRQSGSVPGYVGVLWTGVTTLELARAVAAAIDQDLRGLYHLVPPVSVSKHDLLVLMAEVFGVTGIQVVPVPDPVCRRTLVCTRRDFEYQVPDYRTMLDDLAGVMRRDPGLRWS